MQLLDRRSALKGAAPIIAAAGAAATVLLLTAAPAAAQDFAPRAGDIAVRVGAAWVGFDGGADIEIGGTAVPDGGIDIDDNVTVSGEIEYFFTPNFAASLTLGIPPETTVHGEGDLEAYGELGEVRYGLGALMGKYHYTGFGRFQPFIGAGIAYFAVFDVSDGAISDLEVDDAIGAAVQIGADMMITDRIGLFASVSHAWMDTKSEGSVMVPFPPDAPVVLVEAPAESDITLDPTVVQVGLTVRF